MSANINRVPIRLKDLTDSFKSHLQLGSIVKAARGKWIDRVFIDSFVFSLHSTITVAMLLFFMSFLTMKQYFGEVIECLDIPSAPQSLSSKQMTNYCWMEGAFTIVTRFTQDAQRKNIYDITGQDTAYPGIKAYKPHQGDLKMPHKYYQWIYYILGIQCFLFYAPKVIWRLREKGRLTHLIKKLQDRAYFRLLNGGKPGSKAPEPGFNVEDQSQPMNPAQQHEHGHFRKVYYTDVTDAIQDTADTILIADQYYNGIIKAEMFYFIHLVSEMIFIHLFLGGKFIFLGFQWLYYTSLSDDISFDPLIRIFPRLTKCSFHKFGASGSLETYDTLCFMPMNIVNEKIFVILWFWFALLFIITSWQLIFNRLFCHLSTGYRLKRLRKLAPCANIINSTEAEVDFLKKLSEASPGKSFILRLIAKNLKPYYFRYYMNRTSKLFKRIKIKNKGKECYSYIGEQSSGQNSEPSTSEVNNDSNAQ